jgi:hypothetical protein
MSALSLSKKYIQHARYVFSSLLVPCKALPKLGLEHFPSGTQRDGLDKDHIVRNPPLGYLTFEVL